ncbi:MAG: cytochrome c [Proteobacteria bacterium]|nr:cytochrome c [Pseudomonadota bacterium]
MRRALFLISAFAALVASAASAEASEQTARGRLLVQRYCAGCHAIGRQGASPHKAAPPFRELHQRYAVDSLAEALAEGILVGHPAMPEMRFPPNDVKAILAYIKSIQTEEHAAAQPEGTARGR